MNKKLIIGLALLLLVLAIGLMVRDMFMRNQLSESNPYEYSLDHLQQYDSVPRCYTQMATFTPNMESIRAICVDTEDHLLIAGGNQVLKVDDESHPLLSFSINGEAHCITVGNDQTIYVGTNDQVSAYQPTGKLKAIWPKIQGQPYLTSLAVTDSFVYVADAGNKLVHQYNHQGKLLLEIGRKDTLRGIRGFFIPSPYFDLAIGREGELWVVNPGYHSLESYNSKGDLISSWTRTSMQIDGFSGCCNPSNIAILSDGSFVTSEKAMIRVKIHRPDGDFKCLVAGPELFDEGTHGIDLAVDSKDRIYVMDPIRKVILIFASKVKE